MNQKYIQIIPPPGTSIRQWADGSFHLLYGPDDIVAVRNFFAGLSNNATSAAVEHLELRKKEIQMRRQAKLHRAIPASETATIDLELESLNAGKLDFFEDVPAEKPAEKPAENVENQADSIESMETSEPTTDVAPPPTEDDSVEFMADLDPIPLLPPLPASIE